MSIEPSSGARTLIIADDLTGACDAAVAFSSRGASAEVMIDSEASSNADVDVRAICTETRETSDDWAVKVIHRIAQQMEPQRDPRQYDHVFKKVDSTFRGNTVHEIRAIFDAFRDYFVVVAPAYPALGRISVDGVAKVRDIAGETSIAVRDGLAAVGLGPRCIVGGLNAREVERQMSEGLRAGSRMVLCDAATERDLRTVIEAARAVHRHVLWVGSAGLAHGLAEDLLTSHMGKTNVEHGRAGSTIIFAGSRHVVTQRQMAALEKQMPLPNALVVRVDCSEMTVEDIRSAVVGLNAETLACMVMTGGDTAMLVCRALGVQSLRLHEEFEPGIPYATVVGGPFSGCLAILKSGGFGTIEVLSSIARRFSPEKVAAL